MCGNASGTFALFVELHIHLKSFLTSFLTSIEIMYQVLPPQLFCTVSDEQDLGMRLYVWEEFCVTVCMLLCSYRSSILTGKYVHNHHTYENGVDKGCDAPSWRELNENKTIGAYMSMAGYKTGFFGNYLLTVAPVYQEYIIIGVSN